MLIRLLLMTLAIYSAKMGDFQQDVQMLSHSPIALQEQQWCLVLFLNVEQGPFLGGV